MIHIFLLILKGHDHAAIYVFMNKLFSHLIYSAFRKMVCFLPGEM